MIFNFATTYIIFFLSGVLTGVACTITIQIMIDVFKKKSK
jgi:hypothetical protein